MSRHGIDRVPRWLENLDATLVLAKQLASRGRSAFDEDPLLPLAFEALSNRVGDLSKRLTAADPVQFDEAVWSKAARNRDFVVHHYEELDSDFVWLTTTESFSELHRVVAFHLARVNQT